MSESDLHRLGARLRGLRLKRGLSLDQVAKATGVSSSFLSQVENGKCDITFLRLRKLMPVYGVGMADLVAPFATNDGVVRSSERQELVLDGQHVSVYLLATPEANRTMMPFLAYREPGGGSSPPIRREAEEFIHVLQGSIKISFEDGEEITLAKGDSIYLTEPHRARTYNNASRGKSILLGVASPPGF